MSFINRELIMKELLKAHAGYDVFQMGMEKSSLLKEVYTLGFHAPRQSGQTTFVADRLLKDPKAYAIVFNEDSRYDLLMKISGIPTPIQYTGSEVSTKDTAIYRILIGKDIGTDKMDALYHAETIYFDEARRIALNFRMNKYYSKLAEVSPTDPMTWLLN